jgi:hypothetical protein
VTPVSLLKFRAEGVFRAVHKVTQSPPRRRRITRFGFLAGWTAQLRRSSSHLSTTMPLLRLRQCPLSVLHSKVLQRTLHSSRPLWAEREKFDPTNVERAEDEVDVCIVGAGPAGLSAAIRLKQLEQEKGKDIRVVVLEKGPEVGE